MSQHRLPNPAPSPQVKRFRTNPVETVIFSVITLIFCNSVYNLLYDQQGLHLAALTPMTANPISEGRAPASSGSAGSTAFASLEFRCIEGGHADQDTTASKVRLTGTVCEAEGRGPASDASNLISTQVINTANKFAATVFADPNTAKFSTDYIPLALGKNPIHVEFTYRDGKTAAQDFNVTKN